MRLAVKTLIWYLATHHDLGEPIVELGARQSPGQLAQADLRPFFRGKEYIGCDCVMGVGVDRVMDITSLGFAANTVPTVLCLDTLEHVENPVKVMQEIERVLTDDGVVVATSHMYAPVHYDPDYWRFTPACFHTLLMGMFPSRATLIVGDPSFPELIAGIASKAERRLFEVDLTELNSMLPWPYPYGFQILHLAGGGAH